MFWSRLSADARKFALTIPLFVEKSTSKLLYIAMRTYLLTAMVRIPCYNDDGPDLLTIKREVYVGSCITHRVTNQSGMCRI